MLFYKVFGCILLVISGALVGMRKGEGSRMRANTLAQMSAYLAELAAALQCAPQPTAELLRGALHCAPELALDVSQLQDGPDLPQQVSRVLEQAHLRYTQIPDSSWSLFSAAVQRVGGVDILQALQTLQQAHRVLSGEAQQAAEQARKDVKLYRTLGLSAGAAAALLLI